MNTYSATPRLESVPRKALPQIVGRLFCPPFLEAVAQNSHRQLIRHLRLRDFFEAAVSVRELLDRLYQDMHEGYRCEYLYKNEIIRKIFEARHNPNRSTVLLEKHLAGWTSRTDLIIVNDTTTAYEIKTDHDDLTRVSHQTNSALSTFDHVVVVCTPRMTADVTRLVDQRVGLMELREDGGFRRVRPAAANVEHIDPCAVFALLRRTEYIPALRRRFGPLPPLDSVSTYDHCLGLFRKLSPRDAHAILLSALRRRYVGGGEAEVLRSTPYGLGHLYYKTPAPRRRTLFADEVLSRSIG